MRSVRRIHVIVCRVGQPAVIEEVERTLAEFRRLVDGDIEQVPIVGRPQLGAYARDMGLYEKPPNRCFPRVGTVHGNVVLFRVHVSGNEQSVRADDLAWVEANAPLTSEPNIAEVRLVPRSGGGA